MKSVADRAAKEALFDEFARVAKALASGRRAEIVDLLANGERSVEGIAQGIEMSVANASQHLQILRRAGLVASRRQRTTIFYRLASAEVLALWRALQQVARERLAEVDRLARAYTGELTDIELLTKEELSKRLRRRDDLVVLDVRPTEEFAAGHVPGAVSIPVSELRRRLKELPRGREIVAYCRGPFCAFAPEAARFLRKKGFRMRVLDGGLPEWGAAGLPVEKSASA
jgi:rhodanese-related sulfurtransferase/predicted transcriptional regulator